MRYYKVILVLGLLVYVGGVWGQSPADSLSSAQVARLQEIAEWKSKWDVARDITVYFLPVLGFLLGGLFTYLGIRSRFQKWAEEEITKKASEKVGVDWGIVKNLVNEREALLRKRSKVLIAIVNHSTGERKDIGGIIEALSYPTPKFFVFSKPKDNSVQNYGSAFKKTDFNFLIIDNEDGKMEETEIITIIEGNKEAFGGRIIWYTKDDITAYATVTKAGVGIVKQTSRFQIELDNRLPGL